MRVGMGMLCYANLLASVGGGGGGGDEMEDASGVGGGRLAGMCLEGTASYEYSKVDRCITL